MAKTYYVERSRHKRLAIRRADSCESARLAGAIAFEFGRKNRMAGGGVGA